MSTHNLRYILRLSVDINLTYLPVADRQSSLEEIDDSLDRIIAAITRRNPRAEARRPTLRRGGERALRPSPPRRQSEGER